MRIEIRADTVRVDGYVNAVGRLSRQMTDEDGIPFNEMVEPGAFMRALQAAGTISALLNHDWNRVLADTSGSLKLKEDTIGLYADFTSRDAELISLAKDGKLRGWSFGFIPLDTKEEYTSTGGHNITITELDLKEVSVIDERMIPVYSGTSISTRAEAAGGGEKPILYRAMDGDIICRVVEPPDYSRYDEVINRLKKPNRV